MLCEWVKILWGFTKFLIKKVLFIKKYELSLWLGQDSSLPNFSHPQQNLSIQNKKYLETLLHQKNIVKNRIYKFYRENSTHCVRGWTLVRSSLILTNNIHLFHTGTFDSNFPHISESSSKFGLLYKDISRSVIGVKW